MELSTYVGILEGFFGYVGVWGWGFLVSLFLVCLFYIRSCLFTEVRSPEWNRINSKVWKQIFLPTVSLQEGAYPMSCLLLA